MYAYPLISDKVFYKAVLTEIGVDPHALNSLLDKTDALNIFIKDVKSSWANIIKQEMISVGGDAAINMNCYACTVDKTDILLIGSSSIISKFIKKMQKQPPCFSSFTAKIDEVLKSIQLKEHKVNIAGKIFDIEKRILCFGILNITPDSFSDGGKFLDYSNAVKQAEQLCSNGADIIDIGGESTRPNSARISIEEELNRVLPVIEAVKKNSDCLVSIDSYKPEIIRSALKLGANIVNDISGGQAIFACIEEIKKNNATALIMQNLSPDGISGSLSELDQQDPLASFVDFKDNTIKRLFDNGISSEKVILDIGIGFGLSTKDIAKMLKLISSITMLNIPVCVGISRKSYLSRLVDLPAQDRDCISNAASLLLMTKGVGIFRTHDPKGLRDVEKIYREVY